MIWSNAVLGAGSGVHVEYHFHRGLRDSPPNSRDEHRGRACYWTSWYYMLASLPVCIVCIPFQGSDEHIKRAGIISACQASLVEHIGRER